MIKIKSNNSLKSSKKNVVILDFDNFYYLDVEALEKLSKKDLEKFLEYKIVHKFQLDSLEYEYYYIDTFRDSNYQVYAVKKDIFALNKKKILVPKSLAYRSLSGNYFVLLLEDKISRVMLYADGVFVLSNHIAFCDEDIKNANKMQELSVFLKGIINHIYKNNKSIKNIDILYIQSDKKYSKELKDNLPILKNALNFNKIILLEDSLLYKTINVDFFKGRTFYRVYPLMSLYLVVIFIGVLSVLFGYINIYLKHKSIQQDTIQLQHFYNNTSKDVKEYYELQSRLTSSRGILDEKTKEISELTSHSRAFDITSVLKNVLVSVLKFNVFLQSVEIMTQNSARWVYVDVMFKDRKKIEQYMTAYPNYFVQKIRKEKDMFFYRIKAEIK